MARAMKLILVVDDDAGIRHMVTRLLAGHSIGAVTAASTEEALKTLALGRVDAVLLDVTLGKENGWETLRHIRETSEVPVVMMSGSSMDVDACKDAVAMGAQGVLQKPFESQQLLNCLARLFGAPPAG